MKNVLKKIGSVLFCLLPFLLAVALQLAISIPAVIIKTIIIMAKQPDIYTDINSGITTITNDILGNSQFLTLVSLIYAVVAALILGFWYWKKFVPKKQPRREASQIINLPVIGGLLLLMLGLQYVSNYIVALMAVINPGWLDTYESLMGNMGFDDMSLLLVSYTVFIAPISEELIFRGVTLHYAQKAMPFFAANILQAVLFGALHGNMVQGTYAFLIGLFFGYVCKKGGSIYLPILLHMLFNGWSSLGTFVPALALYYEGDSIPIHILIFAAAVVVTVLGLILYTKGADKRKPVEITTKA